MTMQINGAEQSDIMELREAAARMLAAVETMGSLKAINREDNIANWRDHMEPILTDAHARLEKALQRHRRWIKQAG
jgi:hypothetical protein